MFISDCDCSCLLLLVLFCICERMRAYSSFRVRFDAYKRICMHMHAYACIYMHMHAYACICMHMHAYACICVHVHAHACTCMCSHTWLVSRTPGPLPEGPGLSQRARAPLREARECIFQEWIFREFLVFFSMCLPSVTRGKLENTPMSTDSWPPHKEHT